MAGRAYNSEGVGEQVDRGFEYLVGSDSYQTVFEPLVDNASEVVLALVSRARGIDPASLPVFYDAVDADALDAFVSRASAGPHGSTSSVSFQYADYDIMVSSDGWVRATPLTE